MGILPNVSTTVWSKCLEKKLDWNYTRMLHVVLNKFRKQHSTKLQLYGYLPPILQDIQERWARHVGNCWWNKDKLMSDILLWTTIHGHTSDGQSEKVKGICAVSISWWWIISYTPVVAKTNNYTTKKASIRWGSEGQIWFQVQSIIPISAVTQDTNKLWWFYIKV